MANSLCIDLENKNVILKKEFYKGDVYERVFFCDGGFGLHSYTNGGAVFGYFVSDGERSRIEGYQIERLATTKEVNKAKAMQEKLK